MVFFKTNKNFINSTQKNLINYYNKIKIKVKMLIRII